MLATRASSGSKGSYRSALARPTAPAAHSIGLSRRTQRLRRSSAKPKRIGSERKGDSQAGERVGVLFNGISILGFSRMTSVILGTEGGWIEATLVGGLRPLFSQYRTERG